MFSPIMLVGPPDVIMLGAWLCEISRRVSTGIQGHIVLDTPGISMLTRGVGKWRGFGRGTEEHILAPSSARCQRSRSDEGVGAVKSRPSQRAQQEL